MKNNRKRLYLGIAFLTAFVIWTFLSCYVAVKPIGVNGTNVGLASINKAVHNFTGVNITLYTITDWLGLVPFGVAIGFATTGAVRLFLKRKVEYNLIVLGVFYIAVGLVYLLFEKVVINYRPILIEGRMEVSYPSSTTLLVLTIMPTAVIQFNKRIKNKPFKNCVVLAVIIFTAFMVIARLISGVHWFGDIVGGALLSAGMVLIYHYASELK